MTIARVFCLACSALTVTAVQPASDAQDVRARARAHYHRAIELFEAGRKGEAIPEFEAAQALSPLFAATPLLDDCIREADPERWLAEHPDDEATRIRVYVKRVNAGQLEDAQAMFDSIPKGLERKHALRTEPGTH